MIETRIKISSIIQNQLPEFVKEEFPLVSEFLSQYYISLESKGHTSDILQNIDQYIKVDNLTNLIESTELSSNVTFFDTTISVDSTLGFPDSYGLILIDSEIITYTSKTSTSFEGCIRGFNATTSYEIKDQLSFSETQAEEHILSTKVSNLSILFLKEFFKKVKTQITPGFEDRALYVDLNERLFVKQSIDFYSSKGTDNSFKILFGALYGQNVEVIRPRDYLIQPSSAQYRITSDLVVEKIEGNPEDLVNGTLYQDETENINRAQGTITNVEKIRRESKDYYVISLDSDYDKDIQPSGSVYGKFQIHPKTRVVSSIISGSTTLEVDSTVAFPNSNGNLIIDLDNGTSLNVTYASKTLNQFLDCTGITQDIPSATEIKTDFFAYGYSNEEQVKIRILGVLSDLPIPDNTLFYSKGDVIKIKTLGIDSKDIKANNWFFNIPVKYTVSRITTLDGAPVGSYNFTVSDNHSFRLGDSISLIPSSGDPLPVNIISIDDKRSFSILLGSNQKLDINQTYIVQKNVSKVNDGGKYPSLSKYTSNVQNVYLDQDSLYVASPSLPTYSNISLKIDDRSVVFSGLFLPDDTSDLNKGTTLEIGVHKFYTGDSIVYKPLLENSLGISTGVYFIKKISGSDTKIKLARSRNNIFTENFIPIDADAKNAKFEFTKFTYNNLDTQILEPQKLIRKISNPQIDGKIYKTEPGLTGIFINGVELLNYKSTDNVFYGSIENIVASAPGSGYDVINPPILSIIDPIGFGANAYCSVIGGLERIDIIDPGFDYLENPTIDIVGGNGFGASAKVNLASFDHSVSFNSIGSAGLVKLNPTNTIGFSSYHKFRDAEEVIYVTDGQSPIVGGISTIGNLPTNSTYFVSVQDAYNVKLHKSFEDAVAGINTIQLTSYGVGNHSFKSKNKKKKIGSITIENSGINYQNKLVVTGASGINTASNTITALNHGYNSGEVITYNPTETVIGGLSSSTSYYVTKIDNDQFKLSQIGIGTLGSTKTFYYDTNQYINLTSAGIGSHRFNYPEISVSISGRIGVSTLSGQNFNAIVQPIFRGQVQSAFISSGGSEYGSEDIINYNRQPLFELNSGSGIQLTPIISNGQIVDVLVNSPGDGYNSPPNLQIDGTGIGALLTPILSNGSLVEVKVIYGGIGYNQSDTSIAVTPAGIGAKFEAQIKSWKINLVERLETNSQISDDGGILTPGLNSNYGLQYSHAYAPKYLKDLVQITDSHSPIIGWAYDGNPIYGPYGYASKTGGKVIPLTSGYNTIESSTQNRPSLSIYPKGFFIEDYNFVGNEDSDEFDKLDEHNGRFGITPEYPNGVYAYFSTINSDGKPTFPYAIGPSYKAKPIDFNFNSYSNQDYIDINQTNWRRNITPYNISSYEYLLNPNKIKEQNSIVKSTLKGFITSVEILDGGQNYKINDRLIFNQQFGFGAKAKISSIKGKQVTQISVATSSFNEIEFYPYNESFIGFTSIPHNYLNNDLVTFTGAFDYKKSGNITVNVNNLTLTSGIGSAQYTGIITYFNVSGDLNYPNIKENDIYQIQNEQVKILNIDSRSSRIKVLRNQNGTIGITSYTAGIGFTEKTRKLKLNFGISTSYNFNLNKQLYFDPRESVGLGTTSGVGINSTFFVSVNNLNNQVSIGTGSTTFLFFNNLSDIQNYTSGGYIDIVNATNISFNTTKQKIIGIGATSIKINFDSSSLSGVGVTAYINKWNILEIPTQSIYIENHNLNTGDSLIYSSNGGNAISISTNGSSSFQLGENSIVFVAKISNDLIGISTIKVGLGSIGNFVSVGSTLESGILYFNSIGTGNNHSFKTNYTNTLIGNISKNVVTVSTAETHGLSLLDNVNINVKPGISTTLIVKYDDYNRRLVINPRTFSSIDTINNIITINNHQYYTGQKVIYTATTPATGLVNSGIYYIITIDSNKIKLSDTYYGAVKLPPEVVNITSSQSGTISPINPPLNLTKNKRVVFDLSDSSLSFNANSTNYSAFEFKFYRDEQFIDEFNTTQSSQIFDISGIGTVGITSTANIALTINDSTPTNLFYKLVPTNLNRNSQIKKDILIDTEVRGFNRIVLSGSEYNGEYTVLGITSTTFSFNILEFPEEPIYTQGIEYYTSNSLSAQGSIYEVKVLSGGKGYSNLPSVTSIESNLGLNAIVKPKTSSIGKITSIEIQDIGFDYSADYSVRPTTKFPSILVLEPLSFFDYIKINSIGKDYTSAPDLVVIDGITNKIINDVELFYNLGDSLVTILKNSNSLNNAIPKIIPTNNSNGIKIDNIVFNNSTKNVTVTIGASFSDPEDYPFEVGSKVLIEGTSVGVGSTGKGYNSSNYDYALFTLTAVDPNLGGSVGVVTYNLSSYLNNGEIPGSFKINLSAGRIIPESYFPTFNPVLKKNSFYKGEVIYFESLVGNVESWDPDNQYLKVSTVDDFSIGSNIRGKTSNSVGIIIDILSYESNYAVDSFSKSRKGWNTETGFLNNDFQRIHDSDYYQYFSYALKSQKDLNTWDNPVSSLNHTAGFKKFGNLIVESKQSNIGILTDQNQGDFSGTADLSRFIDLNCVYDFDLARENNLIIDDTITSNEILFDSRVIQDYIESIGNRVLIIDDISNQFNSNPRATEFSIVDSFTLTNVRSKKYFILIQDQKFINQKQFSAVVLLHDNNVGFMNQYGVNTTESPNLGFFDFSVSGTSGNLLFYPVKTKFNNYNLQIFSFSLNDSLSGIGTVDLGDSVHINTSNTTIPQGTGISTSIVGIASTYRASKVLVQIGATDSSYYEIDEITIINDGNQIHLLDYGQITTDNFIPRSSLGIGTYNAYLSGSEIKIDLIPDAVTTVDYIVNTFNVSLANTSASGIGTEIIGGSSLNSSSVAISSSVSPVANIISSYSNINYNSSYYIISIEDITNSKYQVSEILVVTNYEENQCYITEFGILQTESSLGITTAGISGSNTEIYFTPIQNIDVDIKVFAINIGLSDNIDDISLINGSLEYDYSVYIGTNSDIKKEFELKHKNIPIFERYFDSSNPNIIKIDSNIFTISYNYYVTGEEIIYSYPNESAQAIGIATTSVPGIGVTDKLPPNLYVVKLNDSQIRVSASASDALKTIPKVLELTSVGIGSSHLFTSKNQNKKAIVGIDNVIQSPIVSTAITSSLIQNLNVFSSLVYVSGITSIYGGDLIKINEEIMKVTSVGVGSTNSITVVRPWMGTGLSTHSSSSLVSKVYGNYNIVRNKIYFSEAPYGKVPFTNPSSRSDEQDYTGIATGSSFSGRIFLRSGITDGNNESYSNNYIFDNISDDFNGTQKTFTLKSNGTNVSGISTDNAIVLVNEIFQGPNFVDYDLSESSGITSITFTGSATSTSYDVNTSSIPRGGIILSVGSTQGFGYQPLVSAGGTAVVSIAGTIQSISIGNSGSGYRSGIQTVVNVGVVTSNVGTPNIELIGTASISGGSVVSVAITNPGVGYTSSNPPIVIFDNPLSYSNIPLIYNSQSSSGVGTGAVIDIIVGQGSSVISFELKNFGYGYNINEVLTVSIGGTIGIPTNTSLSFSEFQLSIDNIYSDTFIAWSVGSLQVIDPIDSLFDGNRKSFPIRIGGNQTTIRTKRGSTIDVQATLLIFINDILQVPGEGYRFSGGSIVRFTEAPKEGDTSKIIFYRGTEDIDTLDVDILETIKPGDKVTLTSDDIKLTENSRLVAEIISSDILATNSYSGPGITENEDLSRPLTWCRQTEDLVINGQQVGKDRVLYEPYIQPTTNIIQNIGIGSTVIFVESVKAFFDSEKEYTHDGTTEKPQNKIIIISQDSIVSSSATAVVSTSGTISSIVISDGGVGYTTSPIVSIQNPIGYLISTTGNVGINTNLITGINTTNIVVGYEIFEPLNTVSAGTTVTSIGIGTIQTSKTLNPDSFENINFLITETTTDQIISVGSTIIFVDSTSDVSIGSSLTIADKLNYISVVSIGDTFVTIGLANTITAPIFDKLPVTFSTRTNVAKSKNNVKFEIGLGTTALASSTISIGGTVSFISISNAGTGYTTSNPPVVLIETPPVKYEIIDKISYEGDFGIITGVQTTSVGVASTGIVFDLFIPTNSIIRDSSIVKVGIATTGISGIQTGYYFVVHSSNVGNGLTSLNLSGGIVGVGTTFIDNIYRVASVSIAQTAVPGVGLTNVAKVTISVSNYNNLTGLGFSDFYGEYSWGRILAPTRPNPNEFITYANISGISSSPVIQRYNRLKYSNYNT